MLRHGGEVTHAYHDHGAVCTEEGMTSGRKLGVFCMQHGPGTENAYGGVAQAFGDSIPILVVPGGYPRPGWMSETHPNEQV